MRAEVHTMRFFYEIMPAQSLVLVTYEFHPTYRQWTELMKQAFADPQFRPGFDFIFDKRGAGEAASSEYAEAVASFVRKHADKIGRSAIVVRGALAFGMSRMTEGYAPQNRVRVFTEMEEAKAWLRGAPASRPLADAA
jgi:hypothetical protein